LTAELQVEYLSGRRGMQLVRKPGGAIDTRAWVYLPKFKGLISLRESLLEVEKKEKAEKKKIGKDR